MPQLLSVNADDVLLNGSDVWGNESLSDFVIKDGRGVIIAVNDREVVPVRTIFIFLKLWENEILNEFRIKELLSGFDAWIEARLNVSLPVVISEADNLAMREKEP